MALTVQYLTVLLQLHQVDCQLLLMYTMSQKNVPPMACYNFDTREQILIFFGRNVTDKVGNQKML